MSPQSCPLQWQTQEGLFRNQLLVNREQLPRSLCCLCQQHVPSVWPAGWSLSLKKHSLLCTGEIKPEGFVVSPSACQEPCTEWRSMLWRLSCMNGRLFSLHLKRFEARGERGQCDLWGTQDLRRWWVWLVGAFHLQRFEHVSHKLTRDSLVNFRWFKHNGLRSRAAADPPLLWGDEILMWHSHYTVSCPVLHPNATLKHLFVSFSPWMFTDQGQWSDSVRNICVRKFPLVS